MSETWSSRPFISYDGPDENKVRAEVHIVTGYGRVAEIKDSTAGKSKNVHFAVENTKYLPSGWTPDAPLIKKIEEAQENNVPIHFRIETRRKPNVDRTTPIEELRTLANAKDNVYKSIAAVKFEEDDEWTVSQHAVTRLDEDPKTTNGINSAYNYSLEELQKLSGGDSSDGNTAGGAGYSIVNDGGSFPAPHPICGRDHQPRQRSSRDAPQGRRVRFILRQKPRTAGRGGLQKEDGDQQGYSFCRQQDTA